MMFKVEQVALVINKKRFYEAHKLLHTLGWTAWSIDAVTATGTVFGKPGANLATLQFNYTALDQCRELEVLEYMDGPNWLQARAADAMASHFGMHCTEEELVEWRERLTALGLAVVQEVNTIAHTNPLIRDSRRYHYVIFGTAHLIGVDLKFIVRHPAP